MMSPLLWICLGIATVSGALILYGAFRKHQQQNLIKIAFGASAGLIGSLIFMIPLNFCTFDMVKRTAVDFAFGAFLIALGASLAVGATYIGLRWYWITRHIPQLQTHQGVFKGKITPWVLLMPTLAILLLFLYYPSLDTLRVSTQVRFVGIDRTRFICVDNFTSMLGDKTFHQSFFTSFGIAAAIVGLGLFLSLMIATVAFQPVKGASLYRTLLIWSYAVSPTVAGIIFSLLFDPINGGINALMDNVFGFKLALLNDPFQAIFAVVLASVWKTLGFGILFYIAGLQNIPSDLKEAAAIDGANMFQRFWRITVPLLSPITFFLIITTTTYAFFDIFGTIDLLTTGGPSSATTVMIYKIYQTQRSDLGLASAQSIMLFLIVIGLTGIQFFTTGKRVNYGA